MDGSLPRHLTVLTGASRGLGLALARRLLAPSHILLCLSRHSDDDLAHRASACGAHLEQWVQDLADPAEAAERLARWLHSLHGPGLASATLINNAGMIPPIGPLNGCPADALSQALRVGLEAPMLLTAAFLHQTPAWVDAGWVGPRKVLNISSGLGRRPMAGQAPYCAAKAGLDHFSRCTALDEAQRAHGARIVSLAPGVIDTDMQVQLRQADATGFPDQGRFLELKRQGLLSSPERAAQQVLAYLAQPGFGAEPVDDVRG
jgi:benzil reductase ((S)-benzoin forming)